MPEHVIGARDQDILHQHKTEEGSLTVVHNTRDIIAGTIGHVLAIPTIHTILWTLPSAFRNPSKEVATQLFERYKDVPWKGDVLVRVGHTSLLGDLKRMLATNEFIRGRPWMLKDTPGRIIETVGKAGAYILVLGEMVLSKFFRTDFYNPFANTVSVYHPKLAIGMHELGHAEFFNQMEAKKRALLLIANMNPIVNVPFLNSFIEWQASANALKRFKNDEERREGLKRLEGAWATYYISDLTNIVPLPKPLKSWLDIIVSYPASLAGHAMARWYPKKEQRFGYIFEGNTPKKSPQELKPYQRLVARAKPF